jgi:hypothetical protein
MHRRFVYWLRTRVPWLRPKPIDGVGRGGNAPQTGRAIGTVTTPLPNTVPMPWLTWDHGHTVLTWILGITVGAILAALAVLAAAHFVFWKVVLFVGLVIVTVGTPRFTWIVFNSENRGARAARTVASVVVAILVFGGDYWCWEIVQPTAEAHDGQNEVSVAGASPRVVPLATHRPIVHLRPKPSPTSMAIARATVSTRFITQVTSAKPATPGPTLRPTATPVPTPITSFDITSASVSMVPKGDNTEIDVKVSLVNNGGSAQVRKLISYAFGPTSDTQVVDLVGTVRTNADAGVKSVLPTSPSSFLPAHQPFSITVGGPTVVPELLQRFKVGTSLLYLDIRFYEKVPAGAYIFSQELCFYVHGSDSDVTFCQVAN